MTKCPKCGYTGIADLQPEFIFPIIGHTQRLNGFKQFKTIPIGSPIYEMEDKRIFILQQKEDDKDPYVYPMVYRRDALTGL